MKISNLFLIFCLLQISLFGCSSKDDNDATPEEPLQLDPVIVEFKNSYSGIPVDPNGNPVNFSQTGIVDNNRIQSEISDNNIVTEYTYNAFNKVEKAFRIDGGESDVQDFFYDQQNRLIGINWDRGQNIKYYRILHPSEKTVYLETISHQYDNPNAELGVRRILKFDDYDNIIVAGLDINLDETIDEANNFEYDAQSNLIGGQMANGETLSVSYSSIIDTESYLYDKTFGKKMFRILAGEIYSSNNAFFLMKNNLRSHNITLEETQKNTYEVLDNDFFFKRTRVSNENPNLTQTYTLEYIFEQNQ